MAAARVILVSDAHLSANAPRARANWDAVISYVGAAVPDMVIHLGELSLDGAHDAEPNSPPPRPTGSGRGRLAAAWPPCSMARPSRW